MAALLNPPQAVLTTDNQMFKHMSLRLGHSHLNYHSDQKECIHNYIFSNLGHLCPWGISFKKNKAIFEMLFKNIISPPAEVILIIRKTLKFLVPEVSRIGSNII